MSGATASAHVDVQRVADADDLPTNAELARFARAALAGLEAEDGDEALCLRVVGREEGAALNSSFRGRDGATNVLAFPFELPPGVAPEDIEATLGDVVLCADVARDEARAQAKPLAAHVAHLVVHGVLHLKGFDHGDDAEAEIMERREREILAGLGVADPYAAERACAPP